MAQAPPQRNLGRLSEIAQVAVKHGFGYFLEAHRLRDLVPWMRRTELVDGVVPTSQRGVHLREMLDELGPTFVKFGQLLSMRPDIVPPDIVVELRALQDDVRPFPYAEVEQTIVADLGQPVERLFLEFDETPIAAASIGQVHRAKLPNGRDVVDEFARSIRQELDYRLEARNAERFRHNFAGHPHVRVPRVYWSYTRARVLTLEYLVGIQVADLDFETTPLEHRRRLAEVITEAWMTMIFRHGFFHADPHPANLLVLGPEQIGLVDFGQAGQLTDEDMTHATRLFIDVANENVDALPRRLADLGVRFPKDREEEFRAELRELYYRYYGATLSEVDPIQVIREVFALIYSMNLKLPTRFVLLDKAIATLGSLGTELYPDFNVFEVARPYARSLLLGRYTPRRIASRARRESVALARIGMELPYQIHDILDELRDGQIDVGFVHKGLDDVISKLDVVFNRLVVALIVTGGLIGSSLIGIFAETGPQIFGVHFLSVVGFLLSIVLGAWLLLGVIRSGRL